MGDPVRTIQIFPCGSAAKSPPPICRRAATDQKQKPNPITDSLQIVNLVIFRAENGQLVSWTTN